MSKPHPNAAFEGLDEWERALVLAKAFIADFQSRDQWFRVAMCVRGYSGSRFPTELRGRVGDARIERLKRDGWVVGATRWRSPAFAMSLDRVFEVLRAADECGELTPAIDRAWDVGGGGGWERRGLPESLIGLPRALLVAGELDAASEILAGSRAGGRLSSSDGATPAMIQVYGLRPQREWLQATPDACLVAYARALGSWCSMTLIAPEPDLLTVVVDELESRDLPAGKRCPVELLRAATLLLPKGEAAQFLTKRGASVQRTMAVIAAFAQGDLGAAYVAGLEALAGRRSTKKGLGGLEGFIFLLACIDASRRGVEGAWTVFSAAVDADSDSCPRSLLAGIDLLLTLEAVETGVAEQSEVVEELDTCFGGEAPCLEWPGALMGGLMARWFGVPHPSGLAGALEQFALRSSESGPRILADVFSSLAAAAPGSDDNAGCVLSSIYQPRPAWVHALEAFEAMAADIESSPGVERGFRPHVAWEVVQESREPDAIYAMPRVITSERSTTGRTVSFHELQHKYAELLDRHDRAVVDAHAVASHHLELHRYTEFFRDAKQFLLRRVLLGLIGHPRVRGLDAEPIRVERGVPRVVVEGDGEAGDVTITIEPEDVAQNGISCVWEPQTENGPVANARSTGRRLVVYETDEQIERVAHALRSGNRMPREAFGRLRPALLKVAGDLQMEGRGVNLEGERVDPATEIQVDLEWQAPTLALYVGVRPLGSAGPWCRPGDGSERVSAETPEGLRTTQRALAEERRNLERLGQECPALSELEVDNDGARFVVGLDGSCEMLQALTRVAGNGLCRLGWPRGRPLRLSQEYTSTDFNIEVRRNRSSWLSVDASVRLDDDEVVAWRALSAHRSGSGRFVQLDEQRVIRLSEGLARKLEALEALDASHGNAGLREESPESALVPEILLPALPDLLEEAKGIDLVGEVGRRHAEIEAALNSRPRTPRSLRAKLRDYQREGFRWMARLAAVGMGGVLADDMGLGKTVQTLALLLTRRDLGPALVVCPTSVAGNWCNEAARFAPSLEVVRLWEAPAGERASVLGSLGPRQLGVMTYGVLSRLHGGLEEVHISTLIFDEAHALKNSRATRTKSSLGISRDVCFGLTGTPIENHLGELWSVMNVCVPGLLGEEDRFKKGLARRVEDGSEGAAKHLRALLDPFVLRRTKELVLRELPERTEATITVVPSSRERAWYEAQRQLAEERVSKAAASARAEASERQAKTGRKPRTFGQARITMLAEISKLRRAAVEPRLLDEAAPPGAKLEAVLERTIELVGAAHQVLIFTQFLGVIDMLGDRLRRAQIRVLELQGSTSASDRAKRVEAFQAGEADVFLMSLKAGGVGVNLTAADYVLHVDPWWNPAVEDQATGRAHRMGQTRPVTVYRFSTEGTIEPKIFALHTDKRELAEGILGGMESSKKLDLNELRALVEAG